MKKKNVTRKELAIAVNEKLGVSQRNAAEIVDAVFATMKNTMVAGESIKLVQFGTLTVRDISSISGLLLTRYLQRHTVINESFVM
jgi:integration host factor subunit alpha